MSNRSRLDFTPSDTSRLGQVEGNSKNSLEELMERRVTRDDTLKGRHDPQSNHSSYDSVCKTLGFVVPL